MQLQDWSTQSLLTLPRTLALVHEEGALGPFTVRVAGNVGPSERVSRTARFTFQPERTLMLRIDLLGQCDGDVRRQNPGFSHVNRS